MGKTIENLSCKGGNELRCDCPSDWTDPEDGSVLCGCPGTCWGWQKFVCDSEYEEWTLDDEGYECTTDTDIREEGWSQETEEGVDYAYYVIHGTSCSGDDSQCESWFDDQDWKTASDVPYDCYAEKCYAWRKYECVESESTYSWDLIEEDHDCGNLDGVQAEGWTQDEAGYVYYTVYGFSCSLTSDCDSWAASIEWPDETPADAGYPCPVKRCFRRAVYQCDQEIGEWYYVSTATYLCYSPAQYEDKEGWHQESNLLLAYYGVVGDPCEASFPDCASFDPAFPDASECPYTCSAEPTTCDECNETYTIYSPPNGNWPGATEVVTRDPSYGNNPCVWEFSDVGAGEYANLTNGGLGTLIVRYILNGANLSLYCYLERIPPPGYTRSTDPRVCPVGEYSVPAIISMNAEPVPPMPPITVTVS